MQTVYLSRRNLLTLLSKLDRAKNGEATSCAIIKQDTKHSTYPCSDVIAVFALEDEEYYKERASGRIAAADEANIKQRVGEVFYHADLSDGWYALHIDGKLYKEYNYYPDLKEEAKTFDLHLVWAKGQKAAANYYCPSDLKDASE